MFTEKNVRRLVDAVYDASVDSTRWTSCFGMLTDMIDATAAGFVYVARGYECSTLSLYSGADDSALADYAYFSGRNPWIQQSKSLKAGTVFTDRALLPRNELHKTEYYADYLSRYDIAGAMGACIATGDTTSFLSISRPERRGEWSAEAEELIRVLVPHIQSAISIHHEIAIAEHERRLHQDVIRDLALAIVVVDGDQKIVSTNARAQRLLNFGDGLQVREGGLCAAHRDDAKLLSSLIQTALNSRTKPWEHAPRWINVRRPSGGRPLGVMAAPLPSLASVPTGGTSVTLFVVEFPRMMHSIAATLLKSLYDLTPAEARVAVAIGHGIAPRRVASATGSSLETVRKHLKRVFGKTRTRSQEELVRVVSTLPLLS
jgi:DNA-binding CsgD family transcriptional regulator